MMGSLRRFGRRAWRWYRGDRWRAPSWVWTVQAWIIVGIIVISAIIAAAFGGIGGNSPEPAGGPINASPLPTGCAEALDWNKTAVAMSAEEVAVYSTAEALHTKPGYQTAVAFAKTQEALIDKAVPTRAVAVAQAGDEAGQLGIAEIQAVIDGQTPPAFDPTAVLAEQDGPLATMAAGCGLYLSPTTTAGP